MKKFALLVSLFLLSTIVMPSAQAVQNGTTATGSPFVVPIVTVKSPTENGACSGALISPFLVITAAHCVVDVEGIVTTNIYVGQAGTLFDPISLINPADQVSSVEVSPSYQSTSTGSLAQNDVAILTLNKPQTTSTTVVVANNSDIEYLRNSGAPLTVIGYGDTDNSETNPSETPQSFIGNFSGLPSQLLNSAFINSSTGDSCRGDSGAPVLSITAGVTILVGVIDGALLSGSCTQKSTSGFYQTDFILAGDYADLLVSSANEVMNSLQNQLASSNQTLNSQSIQIQSLNSQLAQSQNDLSATASSLSSVQDSLDQANVQIAELQKKLKTTLVCKKGKLTRTVTGIAPKCPTGFTS